MMVLIQAEERGNSLHDICGGPKLGQGWNVDKGQQLHEYDNDDGTYSALCSKKLIISLATVSFYDSEVYQDYL